MFNEEEEDLNLTNKNYVKKEKGNVYCLIQIFPHEDIIVTNSTLKNVLLIVKPKLKDR